MKRSLHHNSLMAGRAKKIILANQFLDDGMDLSDIAKELNRRRFRTETGKYFTWHGVVELLSN